ncbi:ROK family transcriptional regulator [Aurantimonas sp. VKM B-3413]|uniref:ROK family protein n=1 Tax=Aurantimonas sp. VKM B-3413 TaxID=2779401 RepID=UPI001E5C65A0|nr:ROK family transcriptional regulator [Aurantimonas sp. VKM B-3413]
MLAKTDADAVRAHNRRAVLDHLRRVRTASRKSISEATGLSVSAASAIANTLIKAGLLTEIEEDERLARRGRPGKGLQIAGPAAIVAAAKIAVGEVALRVSDYSGATLGETRSEHELAGWGEREIVGEIVALLRELGFHGGGCPLPRKIVVSVQGKTDSGLTKILWSPALKARDIAIAAPLSALTGADVSVFNDCSMMPEAFRWNEEFEALDFATLFMGFGVGMGLRLGGATFQGKRSSAVEFGHINHIPGGALCRCGNRGCIEAYAGDYAIWRRATGRPGEVPTRRISDAEMGRLADAARAGEPAPLAAFEEAGTAIGYGLGRIFTLIDPLPIVFTGSGADAMDLMEPAIRRGIFESSIDGFGKDMRFTLAEDVDALIFDAATAYALAALDETFARAGAETREAA